MVVNDTTFKKSLYLCTKFLEKLNDRLIVTSLPSIFLEGSGRSPGIVKLPETFFMPENHRRSMPEINAGLRRKSFAGLRRKFITSLHANAIKLKKKKDF